MEFGDISKKTVDDTSYKVLGAAMTVHRYLGPGLLESVYVQCLKEELRSLHMEFESELFVPVIYRNIELQTQLRCDLIVNSLVVVEVKSIDALAPIHQAQLLSYMRLLNAPKGLLINFNCMNLFKDGQKSLVNELYRQLR